MAATTQPGPALYACADHVSHGLAWQRQDGIIGGKVFIAWACTFAWYIVIYSDGLSGIARLVPPCIALL